MYQDLINKYRSPIDRVIVKPHDEGKDRVMCGGVELTLVTDYNPGFYANQSGVVIAAPEKLRELPPEGYTREKYSNFRQYDVDIVMKPGDTVYYHHNSIGEETYLDDGLYWVSHNLIYLIIRGDEIICPDDHLMIEPVLEDLADRVSPSGIILVPDMDADKARPKYLQGIVRYLGKPTRAERNSYPGLQAGSRIIYSEHSDIELKVGGKSFYRMRFEDILAIDGRESNNDVRPLTKLDLHDPAVRKNFMADIQGS